MQMQDLDRFLPGIRTYAPSVDDLTAFRFLREAARKLCEKARIWKEWDEFTISTPDEETLCTINDASIVDIEAATLDGEDLTPIGVQDLDKEHPGWKDDTNASSPRYITQLIPDRIVLFPLATGALRARLILQPSLDAQSFPDFLLHHHQTLIGKGAAGEALIVPGKDYTNPQLATVLTRQFEEGVDGLVRKTSKGQQRAPVRTTPVFF